MTESELRAQVAKNLRQDDVPEDLWQDLLNRRFVLGVLQGEESLSDIVEEANRELRLTRQLANRSTPSGRKADVAPPPSLQAHERTRAQALAEWLGHHVATIPRVSHWRKEFFRGGTLSAAQAKTLLRSPALRILSRAECITLGIPLIDHEAYIVPKETLSATHRRIEVDIHITWAGGTYVGTHCREEEHHGRGTQLEHIMLPHVPGLVEVWPESVLGELHECSTWLVYRYPWEEHEALWFVLTGEYPSVAPMEIVHDVKENRDLYRHRIILSVDPWVSAKTVWRAYRAAQDRVLAGRDNRPLSDRRLALVRFIAAKRVPHGKKTTYQRLLEEWNRTCPPEWTYDRVSTFHKAVNQTELALRFPQYHGAKRLATSVERVGKHPIPLAEESDNCT